MYNFYKWSDLRYVDLTPELTYFSDLNVKELRDRGYNAKRLINIGYSLSQLLSIGFSSAEIRSAIAEVNKEKSKK